MKITGIKAGILLAGALVLAVVVNLLEWSTWTSFWAGGALTLAWYIGCGVWDVTRGRR